MLTGISLIYTNKFDHNKTIKNERDDRIVFLIKRISATFRVTQFLLVGSRENITITKTCLYNFDSLKPLCYIVKLGFTGVYIIFLISDQNIDCGYSLEPPRRVGSNEYPQSMF